jgi:outer membrane protein TolC
LVIALIALVVSGCQSPLDDYEPSSRSQTSDRLTEISRPQARSATTQPTSAEQKLESAAEPGEYVLLALKRNPAIREAKRNVRRLAARVPQAESLNDPRLQVAPFGEMTETAAGQTGLMTSVSQKLPLPSKLRTRGDIAQQDVAMAKHQLRETRLRIAGDVRRAYWNYYLAVRSIEVTKENQRLLRQFKQTAQAKYKAGTASQEDVLRAATELSNLQNKLSTLNQRKQTATAMLNRLMNRPVTQSLPKPKRLEFERTSLRSKKLLRQAEANNPQVARVRERIEKSRAKRKLANLNRWPDLTVSANYNAVQDDGLSPVATGEDAWWLGFGINIPLWQEKLDAAEREALEGRLQASAALKETQNTVAFRVQDALTRFRTQQDQVALFKGTILPQAEQTVRASMSSYRAGDEDFLTVINNWQKLLQFEIAYHKTLAQLKQDLADLRQQVGQPVIQSDHSTATQPRTQPRPEPKPDVNAEIDDE